MAPAKHLCPSNCILPQVLKQSPGSLTSHIVKLAVSAAAVAVLPTAPWLLTSFCRYDSRSFVDLLDDFGCSRESLAVAIAAVVAVALSIAYLDEYVGLRWPDSWKVENSVTYEEMFCEPTLEDHLVRHPGNAYSNVVYLLAGICVLLACKNYSISPYWMPDLCFGFCLLVHAGASFVWHASNAPKSHYPDLVAMDASISYLLIRSFCMLLQPLSGAVASANLCALTFLASAAANAVERRRASIAGSLDHGCPFSGRARLKNETMPVEGVCSFALMPVAYYAVPALLMVREHSVGNLSSATFCVLSLAAGWTYRLAERFCLDGFPLPAGTLACAIVSPTAVFHWLTGVTLLSGYFSLRSIEKT